MDCYLCYIWDRLKLALKGSRRLAPGSSSMIREADISVIDISNMLDKP